MCDVFFLRKFSKCARYFSPKKSIMCALFVLNFLTLKIGDDPSSQVSLVSWLPVSLSALELDVLRKVNLIFQ